MSHLGQQLRADKVNQLLLYCLLSLSCNIGCGCDSELIAPQQPKHQWAQEELQSAIRNISACSSCTKSLFESTRLCFVQWFCSSGWTDQSRLGGPCRWEGRQVKCKQYHFPSEGVAKSLRLTCRGFKCHSWFMNRLVLCNVVSTTKISCLCLVHDQLLPADWQAKPQFSLQIYSGLYNFILEFLRACAFQQLSPSQPHTTHLGDCMSPVLQHKVILVLTLWFIPCFI